MRIGLDVLIQRCIPQSFAVDLRCTLRTVRRNPGYALSAMFCLALAMGVNTTLFSFLDSMYFRKLPVPEPDRVVQIHRERTPTCTWSEYLDLRGQLRSLRATARFRFGAYADIGGVNQLLSIETTSANYAEVLRLGTTLGRWFTPDDDSPSSEPAMVISHHLWESRMHSDPGVVGRWIRTDVQPFRIVGVAPKGFRGVTPPISDEAWVPEASLLRLGARAASLRVNLTARLVPGATLENARAELQVIDARLRAGNPRDPRSADPIRVDDTSGFLWMNGRRYLRPVLLLMGLVCGIVSLIACVNVTNLLLVRAASRRREMALRRSLGASRARLVAAAFTEGLVLSAGGTALGIVLGHWTGRLLEWTLPSLPIAAYQGIQFAIDWRVMLLLGAAGVLSAILFSLPPALANSQADLNPELNGVGFGRVSRQRQLYSFAQVALSLTLLIATGLLLRALGSVQATDPGFAKDHRLYVNLLAPPNVFQPESADSLFNNLLERARALPGVRNAALSSVVFGHVPGACASASALEAPRKLNRAIVDSNYFEMMHVPIVRGRGFGTTGGLAGTGSVVINETMARTWWPGEDAIGKTVWLGCTQVERKIGQVVGIAHDSRYAALDERSEPLYYSSRLHESGDNSFALIIQTAGNPYQWVKPLMQVAQSAGPRLRIGEIQTLEDAVAISLWEVKWQAALLGSLGLLAIILAAIGLAGVMAYAVSQRTREIGIRMALGAQPGEVQWMVLAQGLRIAGIGIVAGLLVSAASVRLLRNYLYGLSPFDPTAFAAASLLWLVIAVLATWYPARRASQVDPMVALKYE
jgi:putative ABC transport system permease protein